MYPLHKVLSYNKLSINHRRFKIKLSTITEPTTYSAVIIDLNWKIGMDNKLTPLINNNTWFLTTLPPNKRPMACKWFFKIKVLVNETIKRCKARLVAKDFNQNECINYLETFSHVVKVTSIRLTFPLGASNNWFLHQLDIRTTFFTRGFERRSLNESTLWTKIF